MPALFKRRSVPVPTWFGLLCLLMALGLPAAWWVFAAEKWFSLTERVPADVLVVEGWIGVDGIRAAKEEFDRGGYRYIVTAGSMTNNRWGSQQWNYAIEAQEVLLKLQVPADRVIAAPAPDTESHRTYESAVAVRETLQRQAVFPRGVNIFTLGVHSRRSRLVFARALSSTPVGAVSWLPKVYGPGPWWKSSERAEDLLKETVGYPFELLFNSGRL
jgi:uncharacterized SAM-binding protein YcdF (DUF218 family)